MVQGERMRERLCERDIKGFEGFSSIQCQLMEFPKAYRVGDIESVGGFDLDQWPHPSYSEANQSNGDI